MKVKMAKDKYYGKTLRKNFARHEEVMPMPNLLEIQKQETGWIVETKTEGRKRSYLITAAARTAAQNALAAAKRSLGVNSPSRVFRDQVGKMIPAGMAEGISMATPMAQKAVTLSAQTLRDTGRAALDPSGGTVVEAMGAMERPGAQTTAQFTGNLVLEAPLYLDGREIARASAKYTGRQMAYLEGL